MTDIENHRDGILLIDMIFSHSAAYRFASQSALEEGEFAARRMQKHMPTDRFPKTVDASYLSCGDDYVVVQVPQRDVPSKELLAPSNTMLMPTLAELMKTEFGFEQEQEYRLVESYKEELLMDNRPNMSTKYIFIIKQDHYRELAIEGLKMLADWERATELMQGEKSKASYNHAFKNPESRLSKLAANIIKEAKLSEKDVQSLMDEQLKTENYNFLAALQRGLKANGPQKPLAERISAVPAGSEQSFGPAI